MNRKNTRVVIALSGGVDSSIAAALLKKEGYDVIGISLKLWEDDFYKAPKGGSCCSFDDLSDARRAASMLKIPFYVLNMEKEFKESVINYFVDAIEGKVFDVGSLNPFLRLKEIF